MIWIDQTEYDVDYTQFSREAVIEEKYRLQTADGTLHREIKGVFYNYTLQLGGMDDDTYESLVAKLCEPRAFHQVELTDGMRGTRSFHALVEGMSDELIYESDHERIWDGLTVKFIMREPAA